MWIFLGKDLKGSNIHYSASADRPGSPKKDVGCWEGTDGMEQV